MALRDNVYNLWEKYVAIPSIATISNIADYLAFTMFALVFLSLAGIGVALAVLGPSWGLVATAITLVGAELLVAGSFLGLSVILDRTNSYMAYLRARNEYFEELAEQPDSPEEVDVTPNTNPVKQAKQAEQAEQTEKARSRTLPDRE